MQSRQRRFLDRVSSLKDQPDLEAYKEKPFQERAKEAAASGEIHVLSLYYRYCIDCLRTSKDERIKNELAWMASDLGLDPKTREQVIVSKHALKSSLPFLENDTPNIAFLRQYINTSFTTRELLGGGSFTTKRNAFTPYLLGQLVFNFTENDTRYLKNNTYQQSIVKRLIDEARRTSALTDTGETSKGILLLDPRADVFQIASEAYAVCIEMTNNSGESEYLIVLNALGSRKGITDNILSLFHALTHEMVHTQQNFQKEKMTDMSEEKLSLLCEGLTESLVLLRIPVISPEDASYASLVISLLEILETAGVGDTEKYLVHLNQLTIAEVLQELGQALGLEAKDVLEKFFQNFKALARLRRERKMDEWLDRAEVITRTRGEIK